MKERICCICEEPFTPNKKSGAPTYCSKSSCQEIKEQKRKAYARHSMREVRKKQKKLYGTTYKIRRKRAMQELSLRRCLWCRGYLSVRDIENGYRFYHPEGCHEEASDFVASGFEEC